MWEITNLEKEERLCFVVFARISKNYFHDCDTLGLFHSCKFPLLDSIDEMSLRELNYKATKVNFNATKLNCISTKTKKVEKKLNYSEKHCNSCAIC